MFRTYVPPQSPYVPISGTHCGLQSPLPLSTAQGVLPPGVSAQKG